MKYLVTGGAGFIGSHLVDALLDLGHEVIAVDNLSTGRKEFLASASDRPGFQFKNLDLFSDPQALDAYLPGVEIVFHLAANADVRFGTNHPQKDVEQNTLVTSHVLQAMRRHQVKKIVFSSTGSVYGEPEVFPTPETAPFPVQTSLYGASKLAAESLISAYCFGFGLTGIIFRFVSVLGERYSHGHVFDFVHQLIAHPEKLKVLGDGQQNKSYMYVGDCVKGLLTSLESQPEGVQIFNLGRDDSCQVTDSIGWICKELDLKPQLQFTGGQRGWVGDSPRIQLDCSKIKKLGWAPEVSIADGVTRTVTYLKQNPWVFKRGHT